jgi:hypothetical protein
LGNHLLESFAKNMEKFVPYQSHLLERHLAQEGMNSGTQWLKNMDASTSDDPFELIVSTSVRVMIPKQTEISIHRKGRQEPNIQVQLTEGWKYCILDGRI